MIPPTLSDEARQQEADQRAIVRARWRFTLLPLEALVVLLAIFVPFALFAQLDYAAVVPLFLLIGAIVVLFIGAWYNFGAHGYVRGLLRANQPVTMEDLDRIHREQFLLTACYGGVTGLYVIVAVAVSLL